MLTTCQNYACACAECCLQKADVLLPPEAILATSITHVIPVTRSLSGYNYRQDTITDRRTGGQDYTDYTEYNMHMFIIMYLYHHKSGLLEYFSNCAALNLRKRISGGHKGNPDSCSQKRIAYSSLV